MSGFGRNCTSAVPSKLKETLSFENLNCAKGRKKPAPATQPKSSMVPEEDEKPVARGETAQEKAAAKQAEAMETQTKAAKVKEAKEEAEKKKAAAKEAADKEAAAAKEAADKEAAAAKEATEKKAAAQAAALQAKKDALEKEANADAFQLPPMPKEDGETGKEIEVVIEKGKEAIEKGKVAGKEALEKGKELLVGARGNPAVGAFGSLFVLSSLIFICIIAAWITNPDPDELREEKYGKERLHAVFQIASLGLTGFFIIRILLFINEIGGGGLFTPGLQVYNKPPPYDPLKDDGPAGYVQQLVAQTVYNAVDGAIVSIEADELAAKEAAEAAEGEGGDGLDPDVTKIATAAGLALAMCDLNDTLLFVFLSDFFLKKGISQSMCGIIISLIAVGMLGMTPFMPKVMEQVGSPAKTLGIGVVLFFSTRLLTALMPLFSGGLLVVVAMLLMLLQGAVYAFTEVGGLSWVLVGAPPGQKSGAMGVLMMSRSMGMIAGPPIGGILFDLTGFSWTCIIGGLLLLVPLYASREVFSAPIAPKVETPSKGNILGLTRVRLAAIISCVGIAATYAFVPYLQPYFEAHYGIGKSLYGIILLFSIGGLMLGSGVCASVEEQMGIEGALRVGFAACLVGYLLMGPSPLLPFLDWGYVEGGLGLFVLLFGQAFPFTLCAPLMMNIAMTEGGFEEEDAAIQGATLQISLMALALFFGPFFGGIFADNFGAQWANTINGALYAAIAYLAIYLLTKPGYNLNKPTELV